ncbi:hypothetical protein [Desulfitibacter alkalitolerans]|uniref:hypothetical protein n=1 Tax=Desulfitibacter alkalitolerans TaxID=264641 RepID=UPI00048A0C14|nr:hypothetical protein [Desulfitibacter alkalitolerans]
MYHYTAIINYFDKNNAQRTVRKTVKAKNMKDAKKKLQQIGTIKSLVFVDTPDLAIDNQLRFFEEE